MWTLICIAAQPNDFRAISPSDVRRDGLAQAALDGPLREANALRNGTHATSNEPGEGARRPNSRRNGVELSHNGERARQPEVRIYMHPGRMPVGEVDLGRAGEQFDLKRAQLFGSLDEAEPACANRVGFLLELSRPGSDGAGHQHGGAVLFVEGLRG